MERRTLYHAKRNRSGTPDTALDLIKPVNKKANYRATQHLWIEVEILDTRYVWGKTQYLIAPVSGYGNQWVTGDYLHLHD